jgi:hypothetical protein
VKDVPSPFVNNTSTQNIYSTIGEFHQQDDTNVYIWSSTEASMLLASVLRNDLSAESMAGVTPEDLNLGAGWDGIKQL